MPGWRRAFAEKQETRLRQDLPHLAQRVAKGRLVAEAKVHQTIGRLPERYPQVARYCQIDFDPAGPALTWVDHAEKKHQAQLLDGGYVLKTDRKDLSEDEIWRLYMLRTRVESAFRSMKSPLTERPIFHHLERRVQTHLFSCVLAYHLLVAIGYQFLEHGIHTSCWTLREVLPTHQVVTVVLPSGDGRVLRLCQGSTPEAAAGKSAASWGSPRRS
ncbi:MAG: transposase [Deferrisomatales bacterium]